MSIYFGYISFRYIESLRFKSLTFWRDIFKVKPMYMIIIIGGLSSIIFISRGFEYRMPEEFLEVASKAKPSPYREKCHIGTYQKPALSCEYFEDNVQWAILGDSHTVEIAYALLKS